MHWRKVDVVCERTSGIACVCVVLLEGVGCMQVGRSDYWCNSYCSRFLFQSVRWLSFKYFNQFHISTLVYECSLLINRKTGNLSEQGGRGLELFIMPILRLSSLLYK